MYLLATKPITKQWRIYHGCHGCNGTRNIEKRAISTRNIQRRLNVIFTRKVSILKYSDEDMYFRTSTRWRFRELANNFTDINVSVISNPIFLRLCTVNSGIFWNQLNILTLLIEIIFLYIDLVHRVLLSTEKVSEISHSSF